MQVGFSLDTASNVRVQWAAAKRRWIQDRLDPPLHCNDLFRLPGTNQSTATWFGPCDSSAAKKHHEETRRARRLQRTYRLMPFFSFVTLKLISRPIRMPASFMYVSRSTRMHADRMDRKHLSASICVYLRFFLFPDTPLILPISLNSYRSSNSILRALRVLRGNPFRRPSPSGGNCYWLEVCIPNVTKSRVFSHPCRLPSIFACGTPGGQILSVFEKTE